MGCSFSTYFDNYAIFELAGFHYICEGNARFLEHSRVFYFLNGGKEEFFCSSADWMDRNFFQRVEVAFPVSEKTLKRQVFRRVHAILVRISQ